MASGLVEEVHDVKFDKIQGSQSEDQNHDDVGGDQLNNAMRHMDIGDIRPRRVDDGDEVQVPTQVVIDDSNKASTRGTQHEA